MNKTILIVEDELVLQDVYKLVLSAHGYRVVTANNGFEGLRKLKVTKPDMVLLDISMPVMDGKELLRNVDKNDYPKTKFVVFTNLSDAETEKEMYVLGADKFVLKANMVPQDLVNLAAEMIALK